MLKLTTFGLYIFTQKHHPIYLFLVGQCVYTVWKMLGKQYNIMENTYNGAPREYQKQYNISTGLQVAVSDFRKKKVTIFSFNVRSVNVWNFQYCYLSADCLFSAICILRSFS